MADHRFIPQHQIPRHLFDLFISPNKRKNSVSPEIAPPPPAKHFITEEEMTAEMRRLQIEEQAGAAINSRYPLPFSQYAQPVQPFGQIQETSMPYAFSNSMQEYTGFGIESQLCSSGALTTFPFSTQGQFSQVTNDITKNNDETAELPKLFVSEEVLKIQPQPILPPSLMNTLSKNQLALVPWVPPILPLKPSEDNSESEEVEDTMDLN